MIRRTTIFLLCCFFSTQLVAQTATPKTLLWRISGNGLSKNSFVYGTMHLQDKRLFNFGDSLYHYLEQAEGYALEIDMQELVDSMIHRMLEQREDEMFDRKRLARTGEKKKIIDSLIENVKQRNDKASKKQLNKFREEKIREAVKNKEMPTIMDAYLYGIARRQGKWLGGIEDIQDQLTILDELGGDISEEDLMAPDSVITASLEQMIRIYLSADLDLMEKFFADREDAADGLQLITRNRKMARRMDSLAHIRSMFFTVGAAHLPGESGVISLLRKRGYQVDPVFSSSTIDPVRYAATLKEIPWVKVEDEKKTYEIEMPGKASDFEMFNLIRMQFCVDMTSLTYYMAGSVPFVQKDVDFDKIVENLAENTEAAILSKEKIETKGMKGVEILMKSEGYYYRAQYLMSDSRMYMLITGGANEEKTKTGDTKRFFESLVARKTETITDKSWSSFAMPEKGVRVMMPGIPQRHEKLEKTAEGSGWVFTIYHSLDENSDAYYMLQVRETISGHYLSEDSVFFSDIREKAAQVITEPIREEFLNIQSFPAFRYDGKMKDGKLLYKTLAVIRGNRVYTLLAGGSATPATEAAMERYLNSIDLTAYPDRAWKKQTPEENDFYTIAPGPVSLYSSALTEEEEPDNKDVQYVSYDSATAISYHVLKTPMSPYYWAGSDSLFFELTGARYKAWNDSVVSKRKVTNGNLNATEWVMRVPGSNNLRKLRQFLNGDTLYTLVSYIPSQYIHEKNQQLFFDEFRIRAENLQSTLFKSKAALLLADLRSTDSATFAKVSDALDDVTFGEEDRGQLQNALLAAYYDDTLQYYGTARRRILTALVGLADSTTVAFVQEQFPRQTGEKEKNKFYLLELLAQYKTAYSYAVLKELLLRYPPAKEGDIGLSYRITDSLALARSLFPEILTLSNNHLFAERIIDIAAELLDSNFISRELLLPYQQQLFYIADTTFASLKRQPVADYYGGNYTGLLHLLRHLNTTESNRRLQQYLTLDELTLKEDAVFCLLKNNQPVSSMEVGKIAADKAFRRSLYDELSGLKKLQLFPAKFMTQQSLAESDLYNYTYDEESEPDELTFIGKRELLYKGEKKRFYLFKIKYAYEEDDEKIVTEYLGVAGPYSLDVKNFATENEETGIVGEEKFDAKKIDQQLADYLKLTGGKFIK